jgi:hypothetical protein
VKAVDEGLVQLAAAVDAELSQTAQDRLLPPAGLPERTLLWLALAPVWTVRMAAACRFPLEGEVDDRATRKRLERLAIPAQSADLGTVVAALHVLGILALNGHRFAEATGYFRQALDGYRRLDERAGAAAAEFHLGDIASQRGYPDEARDWMLQASQDETTWADDVCQAAVQRRLASLTGSSVRPGPLASPGDSGPGVVRVVLPPDLEPRVLEACRVLERIARSGLCSGAVGDAPETETDPGARLSERRYWMTGQVRQQIVADVMRDPAQGMLTVQNELRVIGKSVRAAVAQGVPVLRAVQQWAQLAERAGDIRQMADLLSRECDRLLTGTAPSEPNPSGTALGWIQAAAPLEELLKGELTPALDRARRQLDLFHRRRDDDQRYLRRFLQRSEQTVAVRELLDDDRAWALHFIGAGGTGKTMLMRYVSSVLGPQLSASTARIDFDYLSPDYPAQKPGLLLAELAEELRLTAEGPALSLFAHFDEQLAILHEQRSSTGGRAQVSVKSVVETFGMALAALPPPVILLIDTCEELAKVRPDGTSPEGVTRTFALLQQLHDTVPGLRVIFAGRRPLARSGAGWRARDGSELPDRPYLRLQEIRGFTEPEAVRYLDTEGVPGQLQEPILSQARDHAEPDRFRYDPPAKAPAQEPRFNPYDLSGWAVLARQKDGARLTPEDIRSTDSDRYVELRIIRRIRYQPVKLALPALGLLGRCDPALLRAVLPGLPDFDRMFRELRQQEWISRRGSTLYEMDDGLRRRLLAHYERAEPDQVAAAYRRAAEYLERRTLDEPLDTLLPLHFDTAMRVLQREPQRAAQWWARVEQRFAEEEQYGWARQLVEFMLGPEGSCAELDTTGPRSPEAAALRAGVLATQLACFTHTRPTADRRTGWLEVEALLPSYPDPQLASQLSFRAILGKVAAGIVPHVQPTPDEISALDSLWESRPAPGWSANFMAAFIAAVEAIVERAEQDGADGRWSAAVRRLDLDQVARVGVFETNEDPRMPLDLAAFAAALAGRAAVRQGKLSAAAQWFIRAGQLAAARHLTASQWWLDWCAPDDLAARIRLEIARGMYPAIFGAGAVLGMIQVGELGPPASIDAERLASAVLTLEAARGTARSSVSGLDPRTVVQHTKRFRPARSAHRAFPPLATTFAESLAAAGQVDTALDLLTTSTREHERSGTELDAATQAERTSLRIIRRMRLRDEGRGLGARLVASADVADAELLWSLDGLDGAKAAASSPAKISLGTESARGDLAAWWHARWRTLSTRAWDTGQLLAFAHDLRPDADPDLTTYLSCATALDFLEAAELAKQAGRSKAEYDRPVLPAAFAEEWWEHHNDQPEYALRLVLRSAALRPSLPRKAAVPRDLLDRLGQRRAAEIALDEGEMLALRLPERARPILDLAEEWFSGCGDYVGAVITQAASALVLARLGLRRPAFELLTASTAADIGMLPFLPSWKQLTDQPETPHMEAESPASLDRLGPRNWRPWLIRLLACAVWAGYDQKRATRLRRIQDWIAEHYGVVRLKPGTTLDDDVAVPAELDGWLGTTAQAVDYVRRLIEVFGGGLINYRRQWRRVKDLRRRGRPYAGAVSRLLFPFIQIVLLLGYAAFCVLLFSQAGVGFRAVTIGTVVSIVILMVAVPHLLSRRQRYAYRARGVRSHVTPVVATLTVQMTANRKADTVDVTLASSDKDIFRKATIPLSGSRPYDQLRASVPPSVHAALTALAERKKRGQCILELQLDQGLSGPCWEAMLSVGSPPDQAHISPLRIVRTVQNRRVRPAKTWYQVRSAVSLVADLRQDDMATQGWERLSKKRRYQHRIFRPDQADQATRSLDEIEIVHIVATPIETSSGPRLELGQLTGAKLTTPSGSPRGELIRAADIVNQFPDLVFCVLQATPSEHTNRTDAERQQAASLRLIAEEIFCLGVTAVVTIPPLPATGATLVLDVLAEAVVMRQERPAATLTAAIRKAQQMLTGLKPAPDPEAAFDLCLYAAEGRPSR